MKIQTIELYQLDLPFAGEFIICQAGVNIAVLTPASFVLLQMMARMAGVKARHLGQPISRPRPRRAGWHCRNRTSAYWP